MLVFFILFGVGVILGLALTSPLVTSRALALQAKRKCVYCKGEESLCLTYSSDLPGTTCEKHLLMWDKFRSIEEQIFGPPLKTLGIDYHSHLPLEFRSGSIRNNTLYLYTDEKRWYDSHERRVKRLGYTSELRNIDGRTYYDIYNDFGQRISMREFDPENLPALPAPVVGYDNGEDFRYKRIKDDKGVTTKIIRVRRGGKNDYCSNRR